MSAHPLDQRYLDLWLLTYHDADAQGIVAFGT
jgi:hypothetical protein